MFSKFFASATLVLALLSQVHAHAAPAPLLDVGNNPARSDVQRPSAGSPCGKGASVAASDLDSSVAVPAAADGSFNLNIVNFNAGADGARKVNAKVDPTGKGTNLVAMTVTKNGDAAPTDVGPQAITAQLPAGTKCTGGTKGNLCLVQFISTAGFGGCTVVSQGAGAATGAAASSNNTTTAAGTAASGATKGATKGAGGAVAAGAVAATANGATASNGTAATTASTNGGAAKTGKKHHHKGAKGAAAAQAGTRAARALRYELENREEELVALAKRAFGSWMRS